ncbi:AbgT family transporter [Vibrio lentus]|nr:AbgT family transporter [Vibrio lentus]
MWVSLLSYLLLSAYRAGDSVSNIISPLMVFFPLVVVYRQRYVNDRYRYLASNDAILRLLC